MAKAKKLASGSWRTLVYSHTDPSTKKRIYESFTADSKAESEFLAAEFARNKKEKSKAENLTVKEALDRYILSKEAVLSPSTVREYKNSSERSLLTLHNTKLKNLNHENIQKAINEEAQRHSPKSVHDIHGLLSSTLSMFYPTFKLQTTLPKKIKSKRHVPTDNDVKRLLSSAKGLPIEIPILLASTGSLRRSEIAALTSDDVTDLGINVNKAMVMDSNKQWVIKQPKSHAGYRFTPLPNELINKIKHIDGRIVSMNPNQIYKAFKKVLLTAGVPEFRFHDLRHYYASVLHSLNVPDKYIMQYGGWNSDQVLKDVYQHVMEDRDKNEQNKVVHFFDSLTAENK